MMRVVLLMFFMSSCALLTHAQNERFTGAVDSVYTPDGKLHINTLPVYEGGYSGFLSDLMQSLEYPKKATKKGIEGDVHVKFTISESGEIEEIEIVKSSNRIFNKAVIKALKSLEKRFEPSTMDSKPVPTSTTLPVTFRLKKSDD
ncbi:TonB family protein [Halocola ammonii]